MNSSDTRHLTPDTSTLGIIAGGGRLPFQLVESCQSSRRDVFVLAFDHANDPALLSQAPHAVVRLGAVNEALGHLRKAGVKELVLAGHFQRPNLASLMPDAAATKLLARIGTAFFAGDDALLRKVIAFLEDEGFAVVGAERILNSLIAPEGVLGKIQPDAQAKADIAIGFRAAKQLGKQDIGQAVIVRGGQVADSEREDGTDALLGRSHGQQGGVLVKAKKPQQDSRADLPTIGVQTIENAHAAGLSGLAVEAGGSLILDKNEVISRADALGLFVVGVHHD